MTEKQGMLMVIADDDEKWVVACVGKCPAQSGPNCPETPDSTAFLACRNRSAIGAIAFHLRPSIYYI